MDLALLAAGVGVVLASAAWWATYSWILQRHADEAVAGARRTGVMRELPEDRRLLRLRRWAQLGMVIGAVIVLVTLGQGLAALVT